MKKRKYLRHRQATEAAEEFLETSKEESLAHDMVLSVSTICKHGRHWYWKFNGIEVFHWWPARGKWWCPLDSSKGTINTPREAVILAAKHKEMLLTSGVS